VNLKAEEYATKAIPSSHAYARVRVREGTLSNSALPGSPLNARIIFMHKVTVAAANLLAAGTLLLGTLVAQQSSTSGSATKPATRSTGTGQSHTTTATKPAASPLSLTTDKDKRSYALGMNIGESIKRDNMDLDPGIVAQALKDALSGGKLLMTDSEAGTILSALRAEVVGKRQAEIQKESDANKAAGTQFLAANKTKTGVVTLPSGLQYKVLKEGTGPKPAASDTVVCNYKGTLINGTEFDSSDKHGGPATFGVGQVIKGWTEALQLMPVGSKWELYVPADLAYGERSPGLEIGPNSTLIFEIDLLSIKGPEQGAKPDTKSQ
jgi:FKBP-type peptidyl-prolyl cis-trans isomerase FklB